MVPKVSPARASARSCFEYDVRGKHGNPRGEWIAGTLRGTPRQMARMAGAFRALRDDCRKPVWRCSLSLHPTDGRPSLEKWAEIAKDFLVEMGIPSDAAYVAIHHGDVAHDHIHLTVLRCLPNGSLWNEEHSAKRAIKACGVLEARHQLASHDRTPKPKDAPTRAETEIFKRQQKKGMTEMSRETIQNAVDQVLANYPPPQGIDFFDLQRQLAAHRPPIDLQASMPKGKFRGVSYQLDGYKFPGSKIGHEYSVGLVARGVQMPVTAAESTRAESQAPQAPRTDLDRMPAVTRNILVPAPAPAVQEPVEETGLNEVSRRLGQMAEQQVSPLVLTGLLVAKLSVMCIQLSMAAARALITFIIRLLRVFGVSVRQVQMTTPGAPPQLAPAVSPSSLPTEKAPARRPAALQAYLLSDRVQSVEDVDADAAAALEHVLNCVRTGRVADLPQVGEGEEREALVAALTAETKTVATTGTVGAAVGVAQVPGSGSFEPLYESVRAYATARRAVEDAWPEESDEVKNTRVGVAVANQNLLKAQTKFQREHPVWFLAGGVKSATASQTAVVAAATAAFTRAQKEFPPTAGSALLIDSANKRKRVSELATRIVQVFKTRLTEIKEKRFAETAGSAVLKLEIAIGEFRTGLGEDLIAAAAKAALTALGKAIEDDVSLARKRDIEARLEAASPLFPAKDIGVCHRAKPGRSGGVGKVDPDEQSDPPRG